MVKKAVREAIVVIKIITYLTAWIAIILILCERSTPVAAILVLGLYVTSTLAIVRGGK